MNDSIGSSVPLSILVPVYRAEAWLPRFLDGLLQQELPDGSEVICVDDASPDGSAVLIEQAVSAFVARGVDLRLLRHDENRGVSEARQTLLDAARGSYIIYADPDDVVEAGLYVGLLGAAQRTGADFVWEDFRENGRRRCQDPASLGLIAVTGEDLVCSILRGGLHGATWNKLLRHDFVYHVGARFPDGRVGLCEDVAFLCQILAAQPVCTYVAGCHYSYETVGGSATHGLTATSYDALRKVEELLGSVLTSPRMRAALAVWRRGNRLSCFLQRTVDDEYFLDYVGALRDLRGVVANPLLKLCYWFAVRGLRQPMRAFYLLLRGGHAKPRD